MIESFTPEQVESFRRDGFLIVEEGLVPENALEPLRERYLRLFDGEYETGIRPDEVNWVPGRDPGQPSWRRARSKGVGGGPRRGAAPRS